MFGPVTRSFVVRWLWLRLTRWIPVPRCYRAVDSYIWLIPRIPIAFCYGRWRLVVFPVVYLPRLVPDVRSPSVPVTFYILRYVYDLPGAVDYCNLRLLCAYPHVADTHAIGFPCLLIPFR